ncbi:MAG: NUDIX hydrolase [Bacteroidetes bacterium]|nr:NUDIX hydrolase [Bacteroidota bacterium]
MTNNVADNPWKTLKSSLEYETPWISVTHHNVVTPANKEGIYGTVHFKNLAIGILPLDEAFNTWIVGQWRYPLNKYSWEIIEGGGSLNVDPIESAKRELKEEAGIIANRYTLLCNMHTSNSATDEYCYIYLAQELTFTTAEPEETEALTLKKVPFNEVYNMVVRGEITDSLSIAAIFRVKLLMLEGKL